MEPFLVLLRKERPAQTLHARLVPPAVDQLAVFGIVERELAEDREMAGVFFRRLDREHVRIGIPAQGRMNDGGIDAGLIHFPEQFIGGELRNLAVQAGGRHHYLRPDMHLRVDDLHGRASGFFVLSIMHQHRAAGNASTCNMPCHGKIARLAGRTALLSSRKHCYRAPTKGRTKCRDPRRMPAWPARSR